MKKIFNLIIFFIVLSIFISNFCLADDIEKDNLEKEKNKTSTYSIIKKNFSEIWNSDLFDLYIPISTWHNRAMYDKDKTDRYNENPWGIGFGKSKIDQKGNLHQLYIMEFQDSHNRVEVILGYTYHKKWYFGKRKDFNLGLGVTGGATFRADYSVPVILPIFSLNYKFLTIESTYIPGPYNSLNVLFTWLRFTFKM